MEIAKQILPPITKAYLAHKLLISVHTLLSPLVLLLAIANYCRK